MEESRPCNSVLEHPECLEGTYKATSGRTRQDIESEFTGKWLIVGEKVWFFLEGLLCPLAAGFLTVREYNGITLFQAIKKLDPRISWCVSFLHIK